ncbi:ABC transporter substrate-binding protein [Rhizobium sp. KAs_5_22]|uniref:CmpA/NrtA family ABC transporter substrate-binding protein n=1 Tax=Ciceribacter selenitireducens TaxID=448181 RepID=UPI0004B13E6F|nr:CmpA/NrtA family ABC transporter substrate-binding protein [Ciceribacter selenitireducens]PPJ48477.1 ABC transporter substrate-binding protein [Rhizobium sp. KAs_5_22]
MTTIKSNDGGLAFPARIGEPEQKTLRAGFIPLMDASVLLAAAEIGFAAREGLSLDLVRDVSWANVRDRLAFRQFDIAHMLSPMPVASALGLGSNPSPTMTPFSLGRGGNAITLSVRVFERMQQVSGITDHSGALENARALAAVIAGRRASGEAQLTLGMTYPFSSHNYEFRYWLAAGGIDPDLDVKLVVVPPPMTSDALAAGVIDGFCVGAPWNMIASERGVGRIVAAKQDIWPSAPEKVIGIRPDWAERNSDTVRRLIVALDAAACWCDQVENRTQLAELLSQDRYIAAPVDIIRQVLEGEFSLDAKGTKRVVKDYFLFHRQAANEPSARQALWIYSQMVRWGQTTLSPGSAKAAASAFRSDIYREALGLAAAPDDLSPAGMAPDDAFMDGMIFDPTDIKGYVEGFAVRSHHAALRASDEA